MDYLTALREQTSLTEKYLFAESFGQRIDTRNGTITWRFPDGKKYSLNYKSEHLNDSVRFFDGEIKQVQINT